MPTFEKRCDCPKYLEVVSWVIKHHIEVGRVKTGPWSLIYLESKAEGVGHGAARWRACARLRSNTPPPTGPHYSGTALHSVHCTGPPTLPTVHFQLLLCLCSMHRSSHWSTLQYSVLPTVLVSNVQVLPLSTVLLTSLYVYTVHPMILTTLHLLD